MSALWKACDLDDWQSWRPASSTRTIYTACDFDDVRTSRPTIWMACDIDEGRFRVPANLDAPRLRQLISTIYPCRPPSMWSVSLHITLSTCRSPLSTPSKSHR